MKKSRSGWWYVCSFVVFLILMSSGGIAHPHQSCKGFVMVLRGGIGAMAVIDTYYAGDCFDDVPVQYLITIEGDGVLFPGTRTGTVPGMGRTFVHTGIAVGFGSVIIKCRVTNQGKLLEERTKSGFMMGFFVLA
jgi:hypothetical protein